MGVVAIVAGNSSPASMVYNRERESDFMTPLYPLPLQCVSFLSVSISLVLLKLLRRESGVEAKGPELDMIVGENYKMTEMVDYNLW